MRLLRPVLFALALLSIAWALSITRIAGIDDSARALPTPTPKPSDALSTPGALRGSQAIYDQIALSQTSSCWTDARTAIEDAVVDWKKFGVHDDEYDLDYVDWLLGLRSLPAGGGANKRLKEAAFDQAKS